MTTSFRYAWKRLERTTSPQKSTRTTEAPAARPAAPLGSSWLAEVMQPAATTVIRSQLSAR
jgi:hypothetical protein